MYLLRSYLKHVLITVLVFLATRGWCLEWPGNLVCGLWCFSLVLQWVLDLLACRQYSDEDAFVVLTEEWKLLDRLVTEVFERKKETSQKKIFRPPHELWLNIVLERYEFNGLAESRRPDEPTKSPFFNIEFRLTEEGRRYKDKCLEALKESPPPLVGFASPIPTK